MQLVKVNNELSVLGKNAAMKLMLIKARLEFGENPECGYCSPFGH